MKYTEELQRIRNLISKFFEDNGIKIKGIILFGSMARGDFSNYSDYDFLIITERTFTVKEKMEISKKVREHLAKVAVDIILKSQSEIEAQKNQIGTVTREALREGACCLKYKSSPKLY